MVIRKVNNNTFDVFMSDQYWDDWTRVRVTRDGIYGVAGRRLTRAVLKQIEEAVK
jgi:hypothetical protein